MLSMEEILSSKTTQIGTFPNSGGDVVRKNTFFKALAAGVFSLSLIGGSAAEAGQSRGCPVFNAAMVDAAALVVNLGVNVMVGRVLDDPSTGTIECRISQTFGSGIFAVEVNDDEVFVSGSSRVGSTIQTRLSSSDRGGLSLRERHACRAQVLRSFVWQQYCAPELPFAPDDDFDD